MVLQNGRFAILIAAALVCKTVDSSFVSKQLKSLTLARATNKNEKSAGNFIDSLGRHLFTSAVNGIKSNPTSGQEQQGNPQTVPLPGGFPGTGYVPGGFPGTGYVPGGFPGTGYVPGGFPGTGSVPGGFPGTGPVTGGYPQNGSLPGGSFQTGNIYDERYSAAAGLSSGSPGFQTNGANPKLYETGTLSPFQSYDNASSKATTELSNKLKSTTESLAAARKENPFFRISELSEGIRKLASSYPAGLESSGIYVVEKEDSDPTDLDGHDLPIDCGSNPLSPCAKLLKLRATKALQEAGTLNSDASQEELVDSLMTDQQKQTFKEKTKAQLMNEIAREEAAYKLAMKEFAIERKQEKKKMEKIAKSTKSKEKIGKNKTKEKSTEAKNIEEEE